MSLHRSSRKSHKWLMLFIGLQMVVWSVSGAYMVLLDIHYIHGDSLVSEKAQSIVPEQVNYSFKELFEEYPQASRIELGLMLKQALIRRRLFQRPNSCLPLQGFQFSLTRQL